jgi:hypothetical protein
MAADLPKITTAFLDAFQFIKDVAIDWTESNYQKTWTIHVARKAKGTNNWFVGNVMETPYVKH